MVYFYKIYNRRTTTALYRQSIRTENARHAVWLCNWWMVMVAVVRDTLSADDDDDDFAKTLLYTLNAHALHSLYKLHTHSSF